MKRTKLLASLLVVLMLITTMTTFLVSADELDTANLTVENTISTSGMTIKNKTYNLYQVFSAVVTSSDDYDDAIEYFVNEDFYDFFNKQIGITYPDVSEYGDDYDNTDYINAVSTYNYAATEYVNNADSTALVTLLRDYIDNEILTETAKTGSYKLTGTDYETVVAENVEYGYYVVLDTEALSDETTTATVTNGSLVTIPGRTTEGELSDNVTISLKGSTPSIDKDIYHNDTSSWDDVADYQIGDTVDFRLTIEIPTDINAYVDENGSSTYEYIITDLLSDGLDFDNNIKFYTDAALTNEVTGSLHTTTYDGTDADGNDYTFQIELDIAAIKSSNPAITELYIGYSATVTEDANLYTDYEQNEVKLTYSNNPYNSTSYGTDLDIVYGYTFEMDVKKTTGDGVTPLADATFALYEILDSTDGNTHYQQVYLVQNTDDDLDVATYYPSGIAATEGTGVIVTDDTGLFNIVGLDDAKTYVLVETDAPEGYNVAGEVLFKITAAYSVPTETGIPTPTLTISGNTDSLDITVINTSASLLPETGGIGTTIFMIVGAVVMISAVVLLVVRRKKTTVRYK